MKQRRPGKPQTSLKFLFSVRPPITGIEIYDLIFFSTHPLMHSGGTSGSGLLSPVDYFETSTIIRLCNFADAAVIMVRIAAIILPFLPMIFPMSCLVTDSSSIDV